MKLVSGILITIIFSIITLIPCVHAKGKEALPSYLNRYIDVSTIPSYLQVYDSKISGSKCSQIDFINPGTKQLYSIIFSRNMPAVREKKQTEFMHKLAKGLYRPNKKVFKEKIVNFKIFHAHNQDIPYLTSNQYYKKRFAGRGARGLIANYNGKAIVIQSYAPKSNFNETAFIKFFSNIKFKVDKF